MYFECDDDVPRPTKDDILDDNTNLCHWELKLQFKLLSADCDGHIFHDDTARITRSKPVHAPVRQDSESSEEFMIRKVEFLYRDEDAIEIVNIYLPKRLALCRPAGTTAKSAYDQMITRYKEGRALDIFEVSRSFSDVMIDHENTLQYTKDFMAAYYKLDEVTRMYCEVHNLDFEKYMVPEGAAKLQFFQKTFSVEWLNAWRCTVNVEEMELWDLVKSLRWYRNSEYEEKSCIRCKRHRHKNRECFEQHPELDTRDKPEKVQSQNKRARVR
jgi:hypothetical protein